MGLFGNQGSTKSSVSSTTTDSSTQSTNQSSQYGDVASLGTDNKGANQRLVAGGSGLSVLGDRSSVTIKQDLSAGVAHDSIEGISKLADSALNAAASQSSTLASLAAHQQDSVLSAVTGKSVGPDSSRIVVPLALAAAVLVALWLARK